MNAGSLDAAEAAYRKALAESVAAQDRQATIWSHFGLGDVASTRGSLQAAVAHYRSGRDIAETLARQDPGNEEWQRDLSVSHDKVGGVLSAQGDLPGALAAFRASLAIRERLARQDPGNEIGRAHV